MVVLPLPSITVHVIVVAPNGKIAGALFLTLATEQLSEVVTPKLRSVAPQEAEAFTVKLARLIIGAILSLTNTF